MVRTALAGGTLVSVRRGVVLRADAWPQDPAAQHLVRAHAELAANPDAVLSHESAALSWGLPSPGFEGWAAAPVSVTLPAIGHTWHASGAIHHLETLPAHHVQRDPHGYAVTSPARTAVDVARGLELPRALVVLDGAARVICASLVTAVRRRDFANPRLVRAAVDLLTQAATEARAARLDDVLSLVNPSRESAPESLSAGHIYAAGLPMPRFQAEIRTPIGTFFADCLWEDQRLIGECDGAVKYADAQGYVLEKEREQALRDEDFRFVRWQAKEAVLRPLRMIERITRALEM